MYERRQPTRSARSSQRLRLWIGLVLALLGASIGAAAAQETQPEESVRVPNQGTPNQGLPALAFPIDDDDPASSVPTPEQSSKSPLDMGYWVMAVSDRAE